MSVSAPAAPVLICSASRWEAEPLAARLKGKATVLKIGMGPAAARESLARTAGPFPYSLVISAGFCGALQPGMGCGDVVIDARGADMSLPQSARQVASARRIPLHFGKVAHSDVVLGRPADKAALGAALRASAVDMETAAVRAWADAQGLPALAVRVVLDRVEESLPCELPEGEDFPALVRYARSHAAQLPRLAVLGLRQRRAIASLGLFLEGFLERL